MNTDKIYAESLAADYSPKETTKVMELRRLDSKAKLPATITAFTLGVVSSLILGTGMCLAMKVIGSGSTAMTALGIVIGIVGIAGVCVNYPLYKRLLDSGKKKYAADILRLANEISGK